MESLEWVVLPFAVCVILGLWAVAKVHDTEIKWKRNVASPRRPASEVVTEMLHRKGIDDVLVAKISDEETSHFNASDETIYLTDHAYTSTAILALSIAAHEAGHVLLHREKRVLWWLSDVFMPLFNNLSKVALPLFMVGMFTATEPLFYIAYLTFVLSISFTMLTLPAELGASRRAMKMLTEGGYVSGEEEAEAFHEMLGALAWRYVALSGRNVIWFYTWAASQRRKNARRPTGGWRNSSAKDDEAVMNALMLWYIMKK